MCVQKKTKTQSAPKRATAQWRRRMWKEANGSTVKRAAGDATSKDQRWRERRKSFLGGSDSGPVLTNEEVDV